MENRLRKSLLLFIVLLGMIRPLTAAPSSSPIERALDAMAPFQVTGKEEGVSFTDHLHYWIDETVHGSKHA